MPARIAKLSAEGRRIVEKAGEAKGAASALLDQRIEEAGGELGACEARLARVERDLATLDQVEIEGKWVVQALVEFDSVWDVLTIENRARLVRALVRRVEVDETTGEATAVLSSEAVDGHEPWTERTLRRIVHHSAWADQRAAWSEICSTG